VILQRNDFDRFSRVLRGWAGDTVVLLGGGPSLTIEQVQAVYARHAADELRCIAINDSYLLAPWADVLYAADPRWHGWHAVRESFKSFGGLKCSIQNPGADLFSDSVHVLRNRDHPYHGSGLSLDPDAISTGRNGGWQALNIAILAGARKVVLLGFDGKPAADGKTHFHAGHPTPTPLAAYEEYRRAFSAGENAIKAAGVRVINCSPGSAIDSFEKLTLEEAL